jgi:hypothetical protein
MKGDSYKRKWLRKLYGLHLVCGGFQFQKKYANYEILNSTNERELSEYECSNFTHALLGQTGLDSAKVIQY